LVAKRPERINQSAVDRPPLLAEMAMMDTRQVSPTRLGKGSFCVGGGQFSYGVGLGGKGVLISRYKR